MKVRWTEDSVRLRITPPELDALMRNELVRVRQTFVNGAHGWNAAILPGCAVSGLHFANGELLFRLSQADRAELANAESEGVYFEQASEESDRTFRYYIEKDFPCVHPRAIEALEPPTETFSPPPDFEARKQIAE